MIKHVMAVLLLALAYTAQPISAVAQLFTTSPAIVQPSEKNLKIYFHSDLSGKQELKNAAALYAHIGVTLAESPATWTHVKGDWNSNTSDKKFTKINDNLWELNIGDFRSYFGLTGNENVAKIAIIARIATGAGNGYGQTDDCFIDVAPEGMQLSLTTEGNIPSAFHGVHTIAFNVYATSNCDLSLTINGKQTGSVTGTKLKVSYNFTPADTPYTIVATARNNNEVITESMQISCMPNSSNKTYPGGTPRQGAVKNNDGTVTFCLAAPEKTNAVLVGAWNNYAIESSGVMNYTDYQGQRYFWKTISTSLSENEYIPYYYMIDGSACVADPYAHLILDPYSDSDLPESCFKNLPTYPEGKVPANTMLAVYRGDIDMYDWDNATTDFKVPDHRSLTIYELLLRDFTGDGSDRDGKSFGTFRLATDKVEYLASLGINAVELMPVMEFTGNSSWGYNTNFYMAPDKAYGTPEDMRDFVAECHRHGIAVILDIVFNQSDGLAPWFQMYGSSASNPFYNATAPHDYSVLNDWNQDNPLVKQHWKDVLHYWMEAYRVDGFRFDLVKGLGSNSSYTSGTDTYNSSRVDLMKELHAVITEIKPDAIHINELLGSEKEDNENGADGQLSWSNVSQASYDYATARPGGSAGGMTGFLASSRNRKIGQTVDYAESHDEPRIASKMRTTNTRECDASVAYTATHPKSSSVRRLGSVAAHMLLTPGSKMIWQFGEIAADDAQGSDMEKLRAISPKWNQMTNNMRAALLENYRQLIHLRKLNPEMFNGEDATCTLSGFNNSLESIRTIRIVGDNKEIIAFFNPAVSGNAKSIMSTASYLTPANAQLITASYGTETELTSAGGTTLSVQLGPNEFAVYATSTTSDVKQIMPDEYNSLPLLTTSSGKITINGSFNKLSVYTITGTAVAVLSPTDSGSEITIAPGIYIIHIDGKVFKVAVP